MLADAMKCPPQEEESSAGRRIGPGRPAPSGGQQAPKDGLGILRAQYRASCHFFNRTVIHRGSIIVETGSADRKTKWKPS